MRYGDILHYNWGGDDTVHSTVMFIFNTRDHRLALLPIADTHMGTPLQAPIVSKMRGGYSPCTPFCPHNPGHDAFVKENQ